MRKITILLIENDIEHCNKYAEYVKTQGNKYVLKISHGIRQGLKLVQSQKFNTILLDLEINKNDGDGNGINFLIELQKFRLNYHPFIIVITNSVSDLTHAKAREFGADFIFTKDKIDYSPEMVIGFSEMFFNSPTQAQKSFEPRDVKNLVEKDIEINSGANG